MKVSPIQESFNAGEFSDIVSARVRFDKYKNAVQLSENMIPLVQGGMTRRTGTMFISEVKNSAKSTRLVRFEFSVTQAYVIEFGDLYCRFYKDHGVIESSPGVPYEVVTTYTQAQLFELKFTQSADILYITHPSHPPRKLSRTAHTSWTLTDITFKDGPYLNTNTSAATMTPSATTGTVTITASTATFASTDVGRLIRIKHASTWGNATITAYTSSTVVTATVNSAFGGSSAVTSWRLGVWSATTGYPACSAFFEDRLFFAGCTSRPQRLDGSIVGDYENFAPTATDGVVADDNAIAVSLNSDDVNVIRWMTDDEKGLMVGTVSGEWIVRPSSLSEAMTPTNISAKRSTRHGSANIQAVKTGKAAIFVQRSGRKTRELAYVYDVDGFRSPDLTVLSSHILRGGVIQTAYQQEPYSIVWLIRSDGQLIGLTYERDQDVVGWHRHIIGGSFGSGDAVVESIAVIPAPNGESDEVWLIVKRTINGGTVRYVEYITGEFSSSDTTDAFFVDCGLTYSGAPATTLSGLGHLEGETVSVLADGASHPNATVASGQITLSRSSSVVHVGLPYISKVKTLRIEAGSQDGTAQGKTKRIHRMTIRLFETLGLKFGPNENTLDTISFRTSIDPMGSAPGLFTGDKTFNWNGGYDTEGIIYFEQNQPLPFTLLGIFPQLVTQDRG